MRTVTYRDGVYRIESGPGDDFWAVIDPPAKFAYETEPAWAWAVEG